MSSQVFAERAPNSYSIIYYNSLIVEGQFVTNGISVDWPAKMGILENPMTLCIPMELEIPHSDFYDTFELGLIETLRDGSKIIVRQNEFRRGGVQVINGSICGPISRRGMPTSSNIVTLQVRTLVLLYERQKQPTNRFWLSLSSLLSSIGFSLLVSLVELRRLTTVVCTYQLVDIALQRPVRWEQKFFFSIIIFVFLLSM